MVLEMLVEPTGLVSRTAYTAVNTIGWLEKKIADFDVGRDMAGF